MQLSNTDIAALDASEPIFKNDPDTVSNLFFVRLFEIAPELRPMFPSDLHAQGRKLIEAISIVIQTITDWQVLAPVLTGLARRHVGYGVQSAHYDLVGRALIDTLEAAGAPTEQRVAWTRAYRMVVSYMIAQCVLDSARNNSRDAETHPEAVR